MLLRSITQHVKEQNWFAVGLDFTIVVIGVYIGMQVANQNEIRSFNDKEFKLLIELKREIEASVKDVNIKIDTIKQVVSAIERSASFIEKKESCANECWPVLVDFLHASQWFTLDVTRTTYDEMRRLSLPRSRKIVDAVEVYLSQNKLSAIVAIDKPAFREHVRGLVPIAVHEIYWVTCYEAKDGNETYILGCPKGVSDAVAQRAVDAIVQSPKILENLTFWYSDQYFMPDTLTIQNEAATKAIEAIELELKSRR